VTATATITDGTSPAGAPIPAKPWALGWSLDGATLYVSHLLSPNVSSLDATTLASTMTLSIPDLPRSTTSPLIANGKARALYDVVARPGSSGEIWVPHMMLATTTPQTDAPSVLNFQTTAFPTISVLKGDGTYVTRMSTTATGISGGMGAFDDVVSGPHALEFTADGSWALMLDSASEDILAVDADGYYEQQLLSPLDNTGDAPPHMLEGIVISPDGNFAYVDERNVGVLGGPGAVGVIDVDTSGGTLVLTVDASSPLPRFAGSDPMPAAMRHGQFIFNTSNSTSTIEMLPITTNNWISCSTCHPEGRSDAVTWQFEQGPRDTPSNAGGLLDTGFLFRTADRRVVTDYWQTIDKEQGGDFASTAPDGGAAAPTAPALVTALTDLQTYVNFAIPAPVPPVTDPAMVDAGKALFEGVALCTQCHSGTAHTDSGQGNPNLDLGGPIVSSVQDGGVLLHDVGTCNTGSFPDVAHTDEDGDPRDACTMGFDTPTLRGIADSAPYLHDGSAPTLLDVLVNTKGKMGNTATLTSDQLAALVEYLRSL
jgi:mono/diheme cytochrome c family protein